MIRLRGAEIEITCDEGGRALSLVDVRRGTRWLLDPETLVYGTSTDLQQRQPLEPIAAEQRGPDTVALSYRAGEASLVVLYRLQGDGVEVRLPQPAPDAVRFVACPGSFHPEGERLRLLLPIMQGMLWDGRGEPFDAVRGEGSHTGFSMGFAGYMGESGGLLVMVETRDDHRWWLGKDATGRFWVTDMQIDSLGTLRYERVLRIACTDADIVAVAKRYRRGVIEAGSFVSWGEKLAARPALERLFGSLMCFVGYCQDDIDYLAALRRLKGAGFDRALVYPVRFNSYDPEIRMGGVPAIHLDEATVAGIKELGYDVAPWSWLNEALGGADSVRQGMLRRDVRGEAMKHWAIDDQQWYGVCGTLMEAHQKRALAGAMADMTWDHFDVLACVPPQECYALDHPAHVGHAMSRGEEREWIRRTFVADQARGLAVSSEDFNDVYARELDIGSVKAWPQYGPWPFWPVPLTMLVYHDSMIHSWWEVHSYNVNAFGRTRAGQAFEYGGGRPRLMASLDALMGCPPDVFPFGAQYGWTGNGVETYLYRTRLEDPEVQIALREALPVARLHRQIGQQEMVHFRILSEDGYVQESAFADGTRVVANFSRDVIGGRRGIGHVVVEGVDSLGPESWQASH